MKKTNKIIAMLLVIVMMAALTSIAAFADDSTTETTGGTTTITQSAAPAKAVLTKVFDVPEGVDVPNATFKFDFENKEKPSSVSDAAVAQQEIKWTEASLKGEQLKNLYLKSVFSYNDSAIIDTSKSPLTQPGEYVYLVSENNTASSYTHVAAPSTDNVEYDTAKYTLRIYVIREDTNLKISTITVEQGDTTGSGTTSDPAKKVNPDEIIDDQGTEDTEDDVSTGSSFRFTNVYTKQVKTDENDPNGAFNIGKEVTGSGDTAVAFPFTVKIKLDEKTDLQTLTGKVGEESYTFTFANGVAEVANIGIANGEKLIFTTFPAGATVTFTENLKDSTIQYATSYDKKVSGAGIAETSFNKETDASGTTAAINDVAAVVVTNNLAENEITPEGILINNLPYIILAILAIGGLTAYVMIRRKENEA